MKKNENGVVTHRIEFYYRLIKRFCNSGIRAKMRFERSRWEKRDTLRSKSVSVLVKRAVLERAREERK